MRNSPFPPNFNDVQKSNIQKVKFPSWMTVVHIRRWSRLVKRLLAVEASNKIGKAESSIDRFSLLVQPSDIFFSYPSFVYAPHLVQADWGEKRCALMSNTMHSVRGQNKRSKWTARLRINNNAHTSCRFMIYLSRKIPRQETHGRR